MANRLDTCLATCMRKGRRGSIHFAECVKNIVEVTEWAGKVCRVANLVVWYVAFWTRAVLAARNEKLFRVVPYMHREDWVPTAFDPIATCDLDPVNACLDEGLEDRRHAHVEQIRDNTLMNSLARNVLEVGGG